MTKVKLFSDLRDAANTNAVEISSGVTVEEGLIELTEDIPQLGDKIYGENGDIKEGINVFVNGKNISTLDGKNTVLKEEDDLAIFKPLGGG